MTARLPHCAMCGKKLGGSRVVMELVQGITIGFHGTTLDKNGGSGSCALEFAKRSGGRFPDTVSRRTLWAFATQYPDSVVCTKKGRAWLLEEANANGAEDGP